MHNISLHFLFFLTLFYSAQYICFLLLLPTVKFVRQCQIRPSSCCQDISLAPSLHALFLFCFQKLLYNSEPIRICEPISCQKKKFESVLFDLMTCAFNLSILSSFSPFEIFYGVTSHVIFSNPGIHMYMFYRYFSHLHASHLPLSLCISV